LPIKAKPRHKAEQLGRHQLTPKLARKKFRRFAFYLKFICELAAFPGKFRGKSTKRIYGDGMMV